MFSIILTIGFILSVIVFFTSQGVIAPKYEPVLDYKLSNNNKIFVITGLVASVFWIYVAANELVEILKSIGTILNISPSIMGLTVLAWGNSVGGIYPILTNIRFYLK